MLAVHRLLSVAVVMVVGRGATLCADDASQAFAKSVRPLVAKYCGDCHAAGADSEAGFDVARFTDLASVRNDLPAWKLIYDQLDTYAMPPRNAEHPTPEERRRLLAWIDAAFSRPSLGDRHDVGRPVLRRLTRLEYNNTVRDLFALSTDVFPFPERLPIDAAHFQPQLGRMPERLDVRVREYGQKYPVLLPNAGLPSDGRAAHGFANRGDLMNASPLAVEKYVELAGQIVDSPRLLESPVFAALVSDPARPVQPAAVAIGAKSGGAAFVASRKFASQKNLPHVAEGSSTLVYQFSRGVDETFEDGRAGVFDAEGKAATHAADRSIGVAFGVGGRKRLLVTPSADLWTAAFATADETSGNSLFTNHRKGVKQFTLALAVDGGAPGEAVVELAVAVLSRNRASGEVAVAARFDDGTSHTLRRTLADGAGNGNTFFAFHAPPGRAIVALSVDGTKFSGDYVLLDDLGFMTAAGAGPRPVAAESPVAADGPAVSPSDAEAIVIRRLNEFLPRAFRRSVEPAEVKRYTAIYRTARGEGIDFTTAMRRVVRGVLASPNFLYLIESEAADAAEPVRDLTEDELANRLAYFLWASMPDEELRAVAAAGKLRDPATLEAQTRRMLRDPKVRELIDSFGVQWLRLDQLYTSKPDKRQFKSFYAGPQGKGTLHAAMLVEAVLLWETVLVEDRSIRDFLDADYTWLNERLAKHYGLEGALSTISADADGDGTAPGDMPNRELPKKSDDGSWTRAKLVDRRRGGVLTLGATLTLSSLPTRTSPVKRGSWVLETIFNRPPKEPKIAVAPLDKAQADDAGLSVRRKLELHRDHATCAVCHDRIDPPGFALENFDAAGAWRDVEESRPIDAAAVLADGRSFAGPEEFKAAVLARKPEFVRAFVEHLLSYAVGRELEWFDQPVVAEIVRAAAADDDRLSRIVVEIVRSRTFGTVRTDAGGAAQESNR
jgi:mono/diheme cytochrome c family protein